MGRPHFVVIQMENREDEKHRMKPWLRENPEHLPEGMHPDTHTSQQLRNGLKRDGWEVEETDTEVQVIFPFEDEEDDVEASSAFALERHLRDYIAKNIEDIDFNGKKLKLFEGEAGVEYEINNWRIDILAESLAESDDNQEIFVIELKLSRGSDQAIGQLMRYMSWVEDEIANQREVNGIIIAQSIDDRLRRSVRMVSSQVELFEYELKFDLNLVFPSGT